MLINMTAACPAHYFIALTVLRLSPRLARNRAVCGRGILTAKIAHCRDSMAASPLANLRLGDLFPGQPYKRKHQCSKEHFG
jgi:hypothetical protein